MREESEMIECPECYGKGEYYEDTSNACSVPIYDCCGGCGMMLRCDNCCGIGEVETDEA